MAGENEGGTGVEEVTIHEIEAQLAKPADPPKLEGDDIPQEFRGKTAKEIAEIAARSQAALKISEEARLKALEERVNQPPAPATAPPAPPAPPKEITKEEFQALYEEDPMAALELYGEQLTKRVIANFESRMTPLAAGAASSAEASARAQYATEFELFGADIKKLADTIPNKSFLATPDGWNQLIAYVRGLPGNFDKLLEHKIKQNQTPSAEAARAAAAAGAGFTAKTGFTPPIQNGSDPAHHGLDEVQRKVADQMGMSYKEYAQWARM